MSSNVKERCQRKPYQRSRKSTDYSHWWWDDSQKGYVCKRFILDFGRALPCVYLVIFVNSRVIIQYLNFQLFSFYQCLRWFKFRFHCLSACANLCGANVFYLQEVTRQSKFTQVLYNTWNWFLGNLSDLPT